MNKDAFMDVLKVQYEPIVNQKHNLDNTLDNFWNLERFRVMNNEQKMCENFEPHKKFDKNGYKVKLSNLITVGLMIITHCVRKD